MDSEEWWYLYEFRRPRDPSTDYAGTLTKSQVEELYELIS